MRILVTSDTVGGVWTYTRELVTGLLQNGCEISLVTLGRWPSAEQQSWLDKTAARWPYSFRALPTDYKLEWMQDNTSSVAESRNFLLECARHFAPDILHSSQFCYGALPLSIPKIVVAHSDVLSWWRHCRDDAPDNSEWMTNYLRVVSRGLRGADVLVAPTAWMLQRIDAAYGPVKSATVIANGRNIDPIFPHPRKLQAVTAGRLWDEAKNIAILQAAHTDVPLLLAGEEAFDGAQATTEDNIRRVGRLSEPDLLRLFAESSIYVVTSRYEPFGLSAVEAALAGCAIVANDIPALREVWGDAALYFARNDADSLSQTLDDLAANPQALKSAAARARTRARRRYSREQMVAGYLALYSRLLSAERRLSAA